MKVGGRRAYELARAGEEVVLAEREVQVTRFELLWREDDRAGLAVECSSGTYVRVLVSDLGDAYCDELERVAIGPFRLEQADPERLLAPEEALAFLPERELDAEQARAVGHGRRLADSEEGDGAWRLTHEGEVLAIAQSRAGELQPVVVLKPL